MPSRWFTGKPHSKDPARQTKFPPETEFGTRSPTGTTERFRVLADRSSGSETVCIRISGPAPLPVSETGESADRDSKPSASGAACRISCVSDRETERKLRVQRGSRLAPVPTTDGIVSPGFRKRNPLAGLHRKTSGRETKVRWQIKKMREALPPASFSYVLRPSAYRRRPRSLPADSHLDNRGDRNHHDSQRQRIQRIDIHDRQTESRSDPVVARISVQYDDQ